MSSGFMVGERRRRAAAAGAVGVERAGGGFVAPGSVWRLCTSAEEASEGENSAGEEGKLAGF